MRRQQRHAFFPILPLVLSLYALTADSTHKAVSNGFVVFPRGRQQRKLSSQLPTNYVVPTSQQNNYDDEDMKVMRKRKRRWAWPFCLGGNKMTFRDGSRIETNNTAGTATVSATNDIAAAAKITQNSAPSATEKSQQIGEDEEAKSTSSSPSQKESGSQCPAVDAPPPSNQRRIKVPSKLRALFAKKQQQHTEKSSTRHNQNSRDKHHHHTHENPAMHQLDHRFKEKASIKLGETIVQEGIVEKAAGRLERTMEKFVEKAAKTSGERTAERLAQRGAERTGERMAERASERALERGIERASERAFEHGVERASERAVEGGVKKVAKLSTERSADRLAQQSAERLGERMAERASERTFERGVERGLERGLEHGMERAAERGVERGVERGLERGLERGVERAAERGLERGVERAAERGLERGVERGVERGIERGVERGFERGLERGVERGLERGMERGVERTFERGAESTLERAAERGLERSFERSGEKFVGRTGGKLERLFGVSSEKIALRFGRGILITLPILGGVFALYLLKSDVERLKEEWSKRIKTSSAFFLGAGIADGVDSILHFFIAFALWKHFSHHRLAVAEELSFACAIASTACAVLGEIISLRIQRKKKMLQYVDDSGK